MSTSSSARRGLAETMSRYLIRRIEDSIRPLRCTTRTEIVELEGDAHLERVQWRNNETGEVELAPSAMCS